MTARQPIPHTASHLESLFAECFAASENTLLCGGATEPFYAPAEAGQAFHLLWYREDFFASALHEISHWCIAGPQRRLLPDFGYWYVPEGRSQAQQAAFQRVEVAPQALEWCLARACRFRFQVSIDNLAAAGSEAGDNSRFEQAVIARANRYRDSGLPARAARFAGALARHWGVQDPWAQPFTLPELRGRSAG